MTQTPEIVSLYHSLYQESGNAKRVANLLVNLYLPSKKEDETLQVSNSKMLDYLSLIEEGKMTSSVGAQQLWPAIVSNADKDPLQLAQELNLIIEENDDELVSRIQAVIDANPNQVKQFQSGKKALIGFFVGAIMRDGGAKVDPKKLKLQLEKILG